jgi:hypothetical protein
MCMQKIQSRYKEGSTNWSEHSKSFFLAIIEHLNEICPQESCLNPKKEDDVPEWFITLAQFYDQTGICSPDLAREVLNNCCHDDDEAVFFKNRWYVDKIKFVEYLSTIAIDNPIAAKRAQRYLKNISA